MDNIEKLENGIGAIYHEIGHVFGYCLANKDENLKLGDINSVCIGFEKNYVGCYSSLYHFKGKEEGNTKIKNNTKNFERTIAWIIEVVSGCTFQALFEKVNFIKCFGPEYGKSGQLDAFNIIAIRPYSSFKFTYHTVLKIQNEYEKLLIGYNVIEKIKPIINEIKIIISKSPNFQIDFEKSEIEIYVSKCNELITTEFYSDYKKLIQNFC
ncbi:hypothetical protein EGI16_02035 [Chryseobacterium sp. G0240]|uniref:hypothetical protein n=1 Tax=Chryseobacterium sp. G0240 TaxID=2487066 RepID=UPI000F45108C|nr:hypothetical protein [Chryseobacterium sp. G0240]ROI06707.1 hypothetical protein EGI16_02035 [Chryseobacterium sp. G0240]